MAGVACACAFADLTVTFVDIVGFSSLAQRLSPGHLVTLLNDFFSAADDCADRHGIEKVKTIGAAYLPVAGDLDSRGPGGEAALRFARDRKSVVSSTSVSVRVDIWGGLRV